MASSRAPVWAVLIAALLIAVTGVLLGAVSIGRSTTTTTSSPRPPEQETQCPPSRPVVIDLTGAICGDNNVCTQDLFYPNETYCENRPRPANTSCLTECFVPSATSGRCRVQDASCQLGDYTECGSFCPLTPAVPPGVIVWSDPACAALFPRNLFFFNGTDQLSRTEAGAACLANQCTRFFIGPTLRVSEPYSAIAYSFGNGAADCMEMLNPALARNSCIAATTFTVNSGQYSQYMNRQIFGNPALPFDWVARVCSFRYTCGRFNQTMLNDPSYTSVGVAAATSDAVAAASSGIPLTTRAMAGNPALYQAHVAGIVAELSDAFVLEQGDAVRAAALPYMPAK